MSIFTLLHLEFLNENFFLKNAFAQNCWTTPVLESAGTIIVLVFEMPSKEYFFSNSTFSIKHNTEDAIGYSYHFAVNVEGQYAGFNKAVFWRMMFCFFFNFVLLLLFVCLLFFLQWVILSITLLLTIKELCLLRMSFKLSLFMQDNCLAAFR